MDATGAGAVMPAAERLGANWPGILHPAQMVDVMNVEVVETAATGPKKTVEAPNLPKQFSRMARPLVRKRRRDRLMHAVTVQQNDIANLAILDAVLEFLHRATVARHQANADFEIPGRRFLGKVEHATGTRPIGSERFLHEDIKVLLDGVGEMDPAKCQRRCKNGNVAWFKAIHGLFVTVEANKFPIVRHIYFAGMHLVETLVRGIELVLEDVGHGDELLVALGFQSVRGCATAAPTTPDEGNLDSVRAGRMHVRN